MSWAEITPQARTLLTEAADQSLSLVLRGVERSCWRCQHVSAPPVLLHPEGHLGCMSWVESVEGHGLALVKDYLEAAGHHAASSIKYRYSKTLSRDYLSHGCPACDALFGAYPLGEELSQAQANGTVADLPVVLTVRRPVLEWWALTSDRDNLWDFD